MNKQLVSLVKNIRSGTGIELCVFTEDLKDVYPDDALIVLPDGEFNGSILVSSKTGRTFIKFRYLGKNYIAYVEGTEKVSENYAFLLLSLVENISESIDGFNAQDILKMLVKGELSYRSTLKFIEDGNAADGSCFAIVIRCEKSKTDGISDFLQRDRASRHDLAVKMSDTDIAYIKIDDGVSDKLTTATIAKRLYEDIFSHFGSVVSVGVGVKKGRLFDISKSYAEALTALNLVRYDYYHAPVKTYNDCMLLLMLLDIPKKTLKEVFDNLVGDDAMTVFGDEDMLISAQAFMENDLNVSLAARELYMHRNTLTYRLDKIERATGLDIKRYQDALLFKLLMTIKRISDLG